MRKRPWRPRCLAPKKGGLSFLVVHAFNDMPDTLGLITSGKRVASSLLLLEAYTPLLM